MISVTKNRFWVFFAIPFVGFAINMRFWDLEVSTVAPNSTTIPPSREPHGNRPERAPWHQDPTSPSPRLLLSSPQDCTTSQWSDQVASPPWWAWMSYASKVEKERKWGCNLMHSLTILSSIYTATPNIYGKTKSFRWAPTYRTCHISHYAGIKVHHHGLLSMSPSVWIHHVFLSILQPATPPGTTSSTTSWLRGRWDVWLL